MCTRFTRFEHAANGNSVLQPTALLIYVSIETHTNRFHPSFSFQNESTLMLAASEFATLGGIQRLHLRDFKSARQGKES